MTQTKTYLALGDSMSIDAYTGTPGGGAVSQFYRWLGEGWVLDNRTRDGCEMEGVPTEGTADLITLTVGGNDLLFHKEEHLAKGLTGFADEHLRLLQAIRRVNPEAIFIVGDVYHPDGTLSERESEALSEANRIIQANCAKVGAHLAPIYQAFLGNEAKLLCLAIEPNLAGAGTIAALFKTAYAEAMPDSTAEDSAKP